MDDGTILIVVALLVNSFTAKFYMMFCHNAEE